MATLNNSNANVFYWPLSTGNKINTAYHIVPKLTKFLLIQSTTVLKLRLKDTIKYCLSIETNYIISTQENISYTHKNIFIVIVAKRMRHYIKGGNNQ